MTKDFLDPIPAAENLTPPIDKRGLSSERKKLLELVEKINHAWLDSMREMRRAEGELSIRLFSCKNTRDAMDICNQWLEKRGQILETEQQLFTKSWTELMDFLTRSESRSGRRNKAGRAAE